MLIRPRAPDDLAACEALAHRVHAGDGYPPRLPRDLHTFVESPGALASWVAIEEGAVVGHVALNATSSAEVMAAATAALHTDAGRLGVVARLLVSPTARRRGIGGALLRTACHGAWALDRRPILDVATHFAPAIALYERGGWERIAEVTVPLGGTDPLLEYVYAHPELAPSGATENVCHRDAGTHGR